MGLSSGMQEPNLADEYGDAVYMLADMLGPSEHFNLVINGNVDDWHKDYLDKNGIL